MTGRLYGGECRKHVYRETGTGMRCVYCLQPLNEYTPRIAPGAQDIGLRMAELERMLIDQRNDLIGMVNKLDEAVGRLEAENKRLRGLLLGHPHDLAPGDD